MKPRQTRALVPRLVALRNPQPWEQKLTTEATVPEALLGGRKQFAGLLLVLLHQFFRFFLAQILLLRVFHAVKQLTHLRQREVGYKHHAMQTASEHGNLGEKQAGDEHDGWDEWRRKQEDGGGNFMMQEMGWGGA